MDAVHIVGILAQLDQIVQAVVFAILRLCLQLCYAVDQCAGDLYIANQMLTNGEEVEILLYRGAFFLLRNLFRLGFGAILADTCAGTVLIQGPFTPLMRSSRRESNGQQFIAVHTVADFFAIHTTGSLVCNDPFAPDVRTDHMGSIGLVCGADTANLKINVSHWLILQQIKNFLRITI